jgi:hypothetical protein
MNAPVKNWLQPEAVAPRFDITEMADVLSSGVVGRELTRMLTAHFPKTTRADIYMAIGMASALTEADLAIAEIEVGLLKAQIRGLGAIPVTEVGVG